MKIYGSISLSNQNTVELWFKKKPSLEDIRSVRKWFELAAPQLVKPDSSDEKPDARKERG